MFTVTQKIFGQLNDSFCHEILSACQKSLTYFIAIIAAMVAKKKNPHRKKSHEASELLQIYLTATRNTPAVSQYSILCYY